MMEENTVSIEQAPRSDRPGLILYTIPQTAEQLQVSTKTIRRWIDAKELVVHHIGRQLRISQSDLQTFIRM